MLHRRPFLISEFALHKYYLFHIPPLPDFPNITVTERDPPSARQARPRRNGYCGRAGRQVVTGRHRWDFHKFDGFEVLHWEFLFFGFNYF
jgi:hypothetical protein